MDYRSIEYPYYVDYKSVIRRSSRLVGNDVRGQRHARLQGLHFHERARRREREIREIERKREGEKEREEENQQRVSGFGSWVSQEQK